MRCSLCIDAATERPWHHNEARWPKTFLGRIVRWVKKDRPLIQSIVVKSLATLIASLLCLTIVGIPIVFYAIQDSRKDYYFPKKVFPKIPTPAERLVEIKKIIGVHLYEALPNLDLKGRMGATGYIDFLEQYDLPAAAMKGEDKLHRPFITFKVRNKATGKEFTQTAFQRHRNDSHWVWGGNHVPDEGIFQNRGLYQKEFERLALVLAGKDPEFELIP